MQCFRLMGMPDRVIAFDELPERLLEGFEMCKAEGFPRHWKEWLGKKERLIKIPPEKDFLTGQVRRFEPIVETDSYFYLVDWNIQPVVDRWGVICDYVRQHVSKDVRIADKLADMAKPLAPNKTDGVTLEPEDVPVIPLPKEIAGTGNAKGNEPEGETEYKVKCDETGCVAEFSSRQAVRMHKMKKHTKTVVPA